MDVAIDADEDGDIEIDEEKVDETKAELNEAIKVIETLKSELNEVNLLNAKLLYVNKLFRSKTLTESQKVKVINAFDRAESVKEVKNIFETIKDAVTTETKKPVNESRSFASKAAGVAPQKPIVESNDFVARMQKLAGII
jgi:prolyl oligopeptidase PreP (S9A serine peptidase family)